MPTPKKESIRQGLELPRFGIGKGFADLFSLSAHNQLVKVVNAFLKGEVKEGETPGILISDHNAQIIIPRRQSSTSTASIAGLPWQISQIAQTGAAADWRTVTVNHGSAWLFDATQDFRTLLAPSGDYLNSTGTGANIVITAGETWYFWVKIDSTTLGGAYDAELNYGTTPPGFPNWFNYPQIQPLLEAGVGRGDGHGYALVGYVDATDTTGQTLSIRQYVYDIIQIPFISYQQVTFQSGSWGAGSFYPISCILFYGGHLYIRNNNANGLDGGDPTGGNDWLTIF